MVNIGFRRRELIKVVQKKKDWNSIDNEMLPKVKDAIKELFGDGIIRPKRITKSSVAGILGVHDKIFNNLPKCREEIEKYRESIEEYWAREVEWAVDKIQREGQTLNLTRVLGYTNMRRKNFEVCIPYLKEKVKILLLIYLEIIGKLQFQLVML